MSQIDAVITSLEMEIEQPMNPFGNFVAFRYIDVYPDFPKTKDMIHQIKIRDDLKLINYDYSYTGIDSDTNLDGLEFTKN
jgi:hypothetical protein|tara:strand:+ start:28 stop:267 length:240 start_codon:yes stop_codon:yes gene_type:complete